MGALERADLGLAAREGAAVLPALDLLLCRARGEQRGELVDDAPALGVARQLDQLLVEERERAAGAVERYVRDDVLLAAVRERREPWASVRPTKPREHRRLVALRLDHEGLALGVEH